MLENGLKEKIRLATAEGLRLRDQLLVLQDDYSQTQQVLLALTPTMSLLFNDPKNLLPCIPDNILI